MTRTADTPWRSRRAVHSANRPLIRNRTITTRDGVKLAVRDLGPPTARHTVVLLHGLCLNKESWSIQIAQLISLWGNNIRIICYDHRGHGDSTGAPMHTYRIDQLADDLAGLLLALDVQAPLTLVGHSMGGMTALAYLGRPTENRPVEPDGLVLVATAAGKLAERGIGRVLATPVAKILYHLVSRAPGTDDAIRALALPVCRALVRHGGYGGAANTMLVTASAAAINATPLTTKAGFLYGLKTYDQYRTLAAVTASTTVISGGADPLTLFSHAHDLATGIHGATLIHEPTAGHMLLHEFPTVVTQAINGTIAAHPRAVPTGGRQPASAVGPAPKSRAA
jgi:pimeloyl-ACP methyl ester carboxylesterase